LIDPRNATSGEETTLHDATDDTHHGQELLSGDSTHLFTELGRRSREFARLWQIVERISRGVHLEETLDFIYREFHDVIPFNRFSYAAVDHASNTVVARWARSDEEPQIAEGYAQPFALTSLAHLLDHPRPRVINDLEEYLRARPASDGTRRLVAEGLRSSLTCPLVVDERPIGFLFFNSKQPNAYSESHVEFLTRIATMIAILLERGRLFSELRERNAIIERQSLLLADENGRHQQELELARRVQRLLVPNGVSDCGSFRLAMHYEPATAVGGDVVDCVAVGSSEAVVYVADAMGHGIPAALVMSAVRTAFHGTLTHRADRGRTHPGRLLQAVNRTLNGLFDSNFVTAACAHLDATAHRLTLSLAGHPPALILRRANHEVEEVAAQAIPLGIRADTTYPEIETRFDPGDMLVLYTDGVTEAAGPTDEGFGTPRLKASLQSWNGGPVDRLVDHLREEVVRHSQRAEPEDDLTILAVEAGAA